MIHQEFGQRISTTLSSGIVYEGEAFCGLRKTARAEDIIKFSSTFD